MPPAEMIAERMSELRGMGISIALSNFILSERTVDYLRPGQEQVKRYFTPGGHDGATADLSIAGHNHSGTRIMRIL